MDDCDLWERATTSDGYGKKFIDRVDGKQISILVHRLIWMQENGHTDLCILHSCDTPACINLDHLREGNQQENMNDMRERGRSKNSKTTHCPQGHEYTEENIYRPPIDKGHPHGQRMCITCRKQTNRR